MICKLTVLCSIRCSLYDKISCQFVTTIIIAVYMQIIIYNSGIKVCNQFTQRHKISLQQIRTTQQPAHSFSTSSSYRRSSRLQRLNNMGRQSIFYLWAVLYWLGTFWSWSVLARAMRRFRHRRGPFWSTSWAVLVFCCMMSSTVGRFGLGRFGDGPFWNRPHILNQTFRRVD